MNGDTPGVIAPPPLIFLGLLLGGLLLGRAIGEPPLGLVSVARAVIAVPLLAFGTALILSAVVRFKGAGTPPEPWKPVSALVVAGVYKFTRNPMYVGMAAVHAGIAVAVNSPVALAALVPALLLIRYGVIAREERYMLARFGSGYDAYRTRVRRWL